MRAVPSLTLLAVTLVAACGGGSPVGSDPVIPNNPVPTREFKNLVYVTVPQPKQLDLYLPTATTPAPVFVQIHGGGWSTGSKDTYYWGGVALELRSRGYAVANIDYRLTHEAKWPAQIHDCKAAIRWLRANAATYNLDPNRIAVWGQSAGALMADLLGLTEGNPQLEDLSQGNASFSSKVQAVVVWYGGASLLNNTTPLEDTLALLGCDPRECPVAAAAASPVTYIRSGAPPFLIMHGSDDPIIPVSESRELAAKLEAAGVRVDLRILGGAGHGTPYVLWTNEMPGIGQWLDGVLR